ncbi:hypothetical protein [Algoriphagus aquaeductus]|nr:hypothetical protein [Algoriphagus aquaeductus]
MNPTSKSMKEVIIKVPEEKYKFFMELVHSLGFDSVRSELGDSDEEVVENLKNGFQELKEIKAGKVKGTPVEDFLNEL